MTKPIGNAMLLVHAVSHVSELAYDDMSRALEPRGLVTRRHRRADGSFDIKAESYG